MTITANGLIGYLNRGAAPRELECLLEVASGKTSKEAARVLGISPGSIEKRLLSLSTKLGVTKRAALVTESFKRGLIAPLMILLASFGGYHAAVSLDSDHQRRGPSRRVVELRLLKARDDATQIG